MKIQIIITGGTHYQRCILANCLALKYQLASAPDYYTEECIVSTSRNKKVVKNILKKVTAKRGENMLPLRVKGLKSMPIFGSTRHLRRTMEFVTGTGDW